MDSAEKGRFINEHIPYKISRLISIFQWEEKSSQCNIPIGYKNLLSRVCLEDGFTSGRLLLQFLGLNAKNGDIKLYQPNSEDDISVEDLGGIKFNQKDIKDISDKDKAIIISFLKRANKGAAHLTKERNNETDGSETLKDGINIILRFLKARLYDPIGKSFILEFDELYKDLNLFCLYV